MSNLSLFVPFIGLLFIAGLMTMYIMLAIWMRSLEHQFSQQHMETDKNYAIAMFVFIIIGLVLTLMLLCSGPYIQKPKETTTDKEQPSVCRHIIAYIMGFVPSIVFLVRAFAWVKRFHVPGETYNFALTIIYILSLIVPLALAAALCLIGCVGAIGSIIIRVAAKFQRSQPSK